MLFLAGLLLRLLAFGALVASANGLKFNFTDVEQCDPVIISFSGSKLTGVPPTSLEIIPLNSTAISVPLPEPSLIYTGIAITFLPFLPGSDFLTSLVNSTGENIIPVSDLIRVLPSPSGNSSCLPERKNGTSRLFSLPTDISQCEELSIKYNTSLDSKAPTVRLFNPKGPSFVLNMTSNNPTAGVANYLMNFPRGKEIVLLMEDGSGVMETSPLLIVGGDVSSDTSCLMKANGSTGTSSDRTAAMQGSPGASRSIIIGSAVGGSALVLIGLAMVIFVVRDRRKRRQNRTYDFDPSRMAMPAEDEKRGSEATHRSFQSGMVSNPIYTLNSFLSPTRSNYRRGSLASWAQITPEDQKSSASPPSPIAPSRIIIQPSRSPERMSLESLDIEGMLNMATFQSENTASRKNSEVIIPPHVVPSPSFIPSSSVTTPTQTFLRPETSPRHLRNPSNVPVGFDSVAFSRYSVNPFDTHASITPSILQNSLRPSGPVAGLPASPRDGGGSRSSNGRIISGTASRSSSNWYGIAQ